MYFIEMTLPVCHGNKLLFFISHCHCHCHNASVKCEMERFQLHIHLAKTVIEYWSHMIVPNCIGPLLKDVCK